MSRTDKDMPWWVITEWWEPYHWRCANARSGWAGIVRERMCDLPAEPVVEGVRQPSPMRSSARRCVWMPAWAPYRNQRRSLMAAERQAPPSA